MAEVVFDEANDSSIFYAAVDTDSLRRIHRFEASYGYLPAAVVPHDVLEKTQFNIYDTATVINRATKDRRQSLVVGEKAVLISIYFAKQDLLR